MNRGRRTSRSRRAHGLRLWLASRVSFTSLGLVRSVQLFRGERPWPPPSKSGQSFRRTRARMRRSRPLSSGSSRPMSAARRSRCWERRSARRSTARSSASVTARRSSRATRTCATPTPSWPRRSSGWRAGCSRWASSPAIASGSGRPNCAEWALVQFATRQGRDHPRQHQPGLPDVGARVRAAPVRLPRAGRGAGVQDLRLRRDGRRGPPVRSRTLEQVVFLDGPDWDGLLAGAATA